MSKCCNDNKLKSFVLGFVSLKKKSAKWGEKKKPRPIM